MVIATYLLGPGHHSPDPRAKRLFALSRSGAICSYSPSDDKVPVTLPLLLQLRLELMQNPDIAALLEPILATRTTYPALLMPARVSLNVWLHESVDEDGAGLDALGNHFGVGSVVGPDSGGEAVGCRVGHGNGVVNGGVRDEGDYGTCRV